MISSASLPMLSLDRPIPAIIWYPLLSAEPVRKLPMADQMVIKIPTSRTKVVAIRSVSDPTVLAHGTKPSAVYRKATQGKDAPRRPVIVHVPQQGKTYTY